MGAKHSFDPLHEVDMAAMSLALLIVSSSLAAVVRWLFP
jgi:hypothetical protein